MFPPSTPSTANFCYLTWKSASATGECCLKHSQGHPGDYLPYTVVLKLGY